MTTIPPSPKPRILVAPLDWGLGHATRCIPIIRELLAQDCEVYLAVTGKTEALLRQEFPQLTYIPLQGYNIHYGKTKWELYGKLLLQVPKILESIHKENEWLEHAIDAHQLDAVISDNRYGLYSDRIPSVFITHQLRIQTGIGEKADNFLQKFNYHFIDEFSACWVPDTDDVFNLSGILSHPEKLPSVPVTYLGPLTRFTPAEDLNVNKHILLLLSGPEPQRSLLEELLSTQLQAYPQPVMVVRGLPGNEAISTSLWPAHFTVVDHLPAKELEVAIQQASLVIGRCGYSTVMDLLALQKKSILIPTPGQTEQEYLSVYLMEKGMAFCLPQENLDINTALGLAQDFVYAFPDANDGTVLKSLVAQLKAAVSKSTEVVS